MLTSIQHRKLTPRPRRRRGKPEEISQKALIQWAAWQKIPASIDIQDGAKVFDYLFAIPNGGSRNEKEAANLKATGVKAGVHDLMLPIARHGFHGLWIEMKAGKNDLTEKQEEWGERMRLAGYKTVTAWSAQEAVDYIVSYLDLTCG